MNKLLSLLVFVGLLLGALAAANRRMDRQKKSFYIGCINQTFIDNFREMLIGRNDCKVA